MSDKRYEANIIRTTAVEPANNLETTSAPGVWSLDEVMELQKKNKWPTVGNVATDVTDVFSTFLYTGNGSSSARTFVNGINLADNGGLVWTKMRSETADNELISSDSNYLKELKSNSTQQAYNNSISFVANNNGYGFSTAYSRWNENTRDMVSWTFRKAAKFFDIVTYSGTGSAQNISHNLGSVPGMIITKRTDDTSDWAVYHIGLNSGTNPETKYVRLNLTNAETANSGYWNDTAPTSTQFTVGANGTVNTNGATYVAYLFAHNNNDGGFGPDQDADIIKCGSYSGNGSTDGPEINLGFEPQFIMMKKHIGGTGNWFVADVMRGLIVGGSDEFLRWNSDSAETNVYGNIFAVTPTGFKLVTTSGTFNDAADEYIYMAIRRGPLAEPTSATDVFDVDAITTPPTTGNTYTSSFKAPDLLVSRRRDGTQNWQFTPRLTQRILMSSSTVAEPTTQYNRFDLQDGVDWIANWSNDAGNYIQYFWKRAPGYLDVVAYTGNGNSPQNHSHNLGVAPEMMWIKRRDDAEDWSVYHKDLPITNMLYLNTTQSGLTGKWASTAPTSSVFTTSGDDKVGGSGATYIAYLFATVAGVSKVGSFSHTSGSATNVDCGFSSGARFIIIKRIDATSDWRVYDTVRGIVSGNDAYLNLNNSTQENSGDFVDPLSSGFTVTDNYDTGSYMFYAIA